MKNIPTICFDDIYEFCIEVNETFHRYYFDTKKNNSVNITVVAKYAKAREIISYFTTEEGFELANVNFHDPDFDGYNDEYLVALCCGLSDNDSKEIWCEPAKKDNDYILSEGNVVYVLDECNSAMIPKVQGDKTFIVELEEDLDEDFEDNFDNEFSDDLELGTKFYKGCDKDCTIHCDDGYINIRLDKDDVKTLTMLYRIFDI